MFVTPDESILTLAIPTDAPPQVAWEFLTKPGQRMLWQPWVTEVEIKGAPGGRRGMGSANHCMHGKDAVVEEILDWRPYDYVTDLTILDTPAGAVKFPHTIEFEPTPTGTTDPLRFAPPKNKKVHAIAAEIGAAYGDALRSAVPRLVELLDAEMVGARGGPRRGAGSRRRRSRTAHSPGSSRCASSADDPRADGVRRGQIAHPRRPTRRVVREFRQDPGRPRLADDPDRELRPRLDDLAIHVGERQARADVMAVRSRGHGPDEAPLEPDAVVLRSVGVRRIHVEEDEPAWRA